MYSFDFSCIVTTLEHEDNSIIFAYIQERLQEEKYINIPFSIRRNYAEMRMNAEQMAERLYKKNGRECINLREIYQIIALTAVVDDKVVDIMERLECQLLIETAVGIDKNIEHVENLIRNGEEVSFFADTIYSESVIKKILQKCSSVFGQCMCFCSSELGKTQKTGSLFWKANQITGIERVNWIYYSTLAENQKQAERVGMISGKSGDMESLETADSGTAGDYVSGMLEKLSQVVLLECLNEKQRVGCCVGAPILLQYVEWVLECANKLNVSKLYFVARDGFILKKIADILIKERQLNIRTKYIYGSRKAWRIPSFTREHSDILELLKWSHVNKVRTYGAFSDIFGLTVKELSEFLSLQDVQNETTISKAALAYSIGKLKENRRFRDYLIKRNATARELLKRYLAQEIGNQKENIVFVELAGGGYTQECLANILAESGVSQITNLYFKMDSMYQSSRCKNYIFWPNAMTNSSIIETLCHAPEGQTLGYREHNGNIVPVLDEDEGQALKEYGYGDYVKGILLYVQKYNRYLKNFLRRRWSIVSIDLYMNTVINVPGVELLRFISDMPFGVTGREKKVLEYAPILTESQLVEYYSGGKNVQRDYCGMHWEYSLLRTQQKFPLCKEQYNNNGNTLSEEKPEEEYPVEFIQEEAFMLCLDQFGENICNMARKRGRQITKLTQTMDIKKYAKVESQIVLAIKEKEQLIKCQAELETLGVNREWILAIDLQPKYILEKQR